MSPKVFPLCDLSVTLTSGWVLETPSLDSCWCEATLCPPSHQGSGSTDSGTGGMGLFSRQGGLYQRLSGQYCTMRRVSQL